MKRNRLFITAASVLALAISVPYAGHGEKCTEDTQACLNMMASNLKERGWAGIELNTHEMSGAMSVSAVVVGSPAEAAGFKTGDVMVALNGIELNEANQEALYAAKKSQTPGSTVTYTVSRNGKNRDLKVTLAEVPEKVLAQWVGGHMLDHATTAVAQN